MQNINKSLDSQKTLHNSPSRASYGVSIVRNFGENLPCYNGTALYLWPMQVSDDADNQYYFGGENFEQHM